MSTIRESRCMGGDLYPSAVISILMNAILPFLLIAYVHIAPNNLVKTQSLSSFLVLIFVSFLLPCMLAHLMRKSNPVWSVNLRSSWSWLGDVSRLIGVSFLLGHRLVRLFLCLSRWTCTHTHTLQVPDESLHEHFSNLISMKQQEQNNTGDVRDFNHFSFFMFMLCPSVMSLKL